MDSVAAGSNVLVVAAPDDTPAAVLQVEEYGMRVLKRLSSQVAAVVCVPSRQMLSGAAVRKVADYEARGIRILDFDSETPSGSGSSSSSSHQRIGLRGIFQGNRAQSASSGSLPSSQEPTPKRSLKRKSSDSQAAAPEEKRLAPWRKACSSATLDRIDRALEQRLYLVKQENVKSSMGTGPAKRFTVLGSTGNVYTVLVDALVSCDCPDAEKGNLCKHQLFVMLRVLRVPASSELLYQKALLASEREELFSSARRPERRSVVNDAVRKAFVKATSSSHKKEKKQEKKEEHRGSKDDDCPICFEILGNEKLQTCKLCSNAVHEDCFRRWAKSQGSDVTCPFCRAKWVEPKATKSCLGREGYLNFGAEAGLPQRRRGYHSSNYWHDDEDSSDY